MTDTPTPAPLLRPTNNTLWVERAQGAEKIGSIITPETSRGVSEICTIRYVDPDQQEYAPGQRVAVTQFSGHRVTVGEESLWVLRPDEVVAVVGGRQGAKTPEEVLQMHGMQ